MAPSVNGSASRTNGKTVLADRAVCNKSAFLLRIGAGSWRHLARTHGTKRRIAQAMVGSAITHQRQFVENTRTTAPDSGHENADQIGPFADNPVALRVYSQRGNKRRGCEALRPRNPLILLVGRGGLEPTTKGL